MINSQKSQEEKAEPIRMCCACRARKPKSQLIRLVKGEISQENPENIHDECPIRIDFSHKADGRGAYLCKNAICIKKAFKKKSLNRAFSCNVPDELYKTLQEAIEIG